MKKLFGPAPNNRNMKAFFRNDTVKILWWSDDGFYGSVNMQKVVATLYYEKTPAEVRRTIMKHLDKSSPERKALNFN